MSALNDTGQEVVARQSQSHGFSEDAVLHMLRALSMGHGSQAQFNHPEFGGMGQWSMGGMTMIGDMFNKGLKARVDGLCAALSSEMSSASLFTPQNAGFPGASWSYSASGAMQSGSGWPADLGTPSSQGAQNDMRYAYFPQTRRLAIAHGGTMTIYDTAEHQISGFGQAQGGDQTLSFTSQFGLVPVSSLSIVAPVQSDAPVQDHVEPPRVDSPQHEPIPIPVEAPHVTAETGSPASPRANPPASLPTHSATPVPGDMSDDQIFTRLEKLADLRDRGIISAEDFSQKKAELLSRL